MSEGKRINSRRVGTYRFGGKQVLVIKSIFLKDILQVTTQLNEGRNSNVYIRQYAEELWRRLNEVADDANAEHLFEQQPNFFLVLVKPTMLLLDPANLTLFIETSESAQTPDRNVQHTAKILLARVSLLLEGDPSRGELLE